MSRRMKLLNISHMQAFKWGKIWENSDFDQIGTISIHQKAVFHDVIHANTTHCFPFKSILILEYKRIIVDFHGENIEVTGCVFHTSDGIRTLVCDEATYQKIKDAWISYHK